MALRGATRSRSSRNGGINLNGPLSAWSAGGGAEVRLDGRPVGSTPLTLPGIRVDERHRIDLVLPGHEIDQFVVLPEKDGTRITRRLTRAAPKPVAPVPPAAGGP